MITAGSWLDVCDRLRRQFAGRLFDVRIMRNAAKIECVQISGSIKASPAASAPRYDIGCLQALPEAIVLELLFAEGLIDPGAPIDHYLPELRAIKKHDSSPRIRVRDVLSHATGYHVPSKLVDSIKFEDIVLLMQNNDAAFPPGSVCSWNSLGHHIYEELIRRTSGKDVSNLVETTLRGLGVPNAIVQREKPGWLKVELSLDDLATLISRTLRPGGVAATLMTRIDSARIPVVRRPVSSRSAYPVAYAHGIAYYPENLLGQNGVGPNYTLGIRFNQDVSFLCCLAVESGPSQRDLVLQVLASTAGYIRDRSPKYTIGAIVGCDIAELPGNYTADCDEWVKVTISDSKVTCLVLRGRERIALIELSVEDDNTLIADARWSTLQIEFFPHPDSGIPCFVLGQVSYVRSDEL